MMDSGAFPDGGWEAWLAVSGAFCCLFCSLVGLMVKNPLFVPWRWPVANVRDLIVCVVTLYCSMKRILSM